MYASLYPNILLVPFSLTLTLSICPLSLSISFPLYLSSCPLSLPLSLPLCLPPSIYLPSPFSLFLCIHLSIRLSVYINSIHLFSACKYGGLHPYPYNCRKYIQCVHGYPKLMPCPPGLVWNNCLKRCDWYIRKSRYYKPKYYKPKYYKGKYYKPKYYTRSYYNKCIHCNCK